LVSEKSLSLQFRFIGRELEIQGELFAESSVSRICDILTIPRERKKWDLRLLEFKPMPDLDGYIVTYMADRTLYEFHTSIKIIQNTNNASIEFISKCYGLKIPNSILGNFHSVYKIEMIEDNASTNDSDDKEFMNPNENKGIGKVKASWFSHFCESSYSLVKGDLFQEADLLKKSFERFLQVAENREDMIKIENSENALIDACNRKKLGKTFVNDACEPVFK
jgi:hypothetical protein